MHTPVHHRTMVAFDFEELFRSTDDTVLQRFRLARKVDPTVVPRDFRPDTCRILRDLDGITLQFYRRESPDDPGKEIFRFSFKPAE